MIKYNPKSWIKLIFALHESDTMRILWKEMIYMALLSIAVAWVEITYFPDIKALSNLNIVYSLVGFVISLLLVFRTNTAYDRWWEGRKKWGELINDTRNLAIKLKSMGLKIDDSAYFARMISNFTIATKESLRKGVNIDHLDLTESEAELLKLSSHVPVSIVQLMMTRIHYLKAQGIIAPEDFLVIDKHLSSFTDIVGACERIKNTPIPFSYSLFIKKFIFLYTGTLPIAFVSILGYFSVIITVFVFYVLVSMEILAEEIEDPFGGDDNDLPLDEIAERIKLVTQKILLK